MTWFARREVEKVFAAISASDWATASRRLSPGVRHTFPGDHSLGGERHSSQDVLRWFERLGRLFPGHDFAIHRVAVNGPPWALNVAVQWMATLRPAIGPEYVNAGAH